MIWETSGAGGGSSGVGLAFALLGGVAFLAGGWAGETTFFFCLCLLVLLPLAGVGGVVVGGVRGLCTSDTRYWHTDTAAACERKELKFDLQIPQKWT